MNLSGTDYQCGTQSAQLFLVISLLIIAFVANTILWTIIVRYKALRTIPNILLANLVIVDMLSALANLPLFMLDVVIFNVWFTGQLTAFATVFAYLLFILLKLYSMVLMMCDRYAAISQGMAYKQWISKRKALSGISCVWLSGITITSCAMLPVWSVNLGSSLVQEYRAIYFTRSIRYCLLSNLPLCVVVIAVLSLATYCSMHRQVSQLQETLERRMRNEARAATTIVIVLLAYVICFMPSIVFTLAVRDLGTINQWLLFIPPYFAFLTSAFDPIMFICRSKSLQSACARLLRLRRNSVMCSGNRSTATHSNATGRLFTIRRVYHDSENLRSLDLRF
ncbi:rhodopsin [Nematostella vectensis]|uniref:rhodopsin n=1 Tax=Nematostella vectensis TaxID=45351 RepID=UPI00207740A5|nr:rhodopsin [Nematostella vectensis]